MKSTGDSRPQSGPWWPPGGSAVATWCFVVVGRSFFLCSMPRQDFKFERTKAANLRQLGPTCDKFDPTWDNLRPISSNLRLASANVGKLSAHMCHFKPKRDTKNVQKHLLFSVDFCMFLKYQPSCNRALTWADFDKFGSQFGAYFGPLLAQCGPDFAKVAANFDHLGANLGQLGPNWGQLGWGQLGANLSQPGTSLGRNWGPGSSFSQLPLT